MNGVLPIAIGTIILFGIIKKVAVFDCFINGVKEGLITLLSIIPTLMGLVIAVEMIQTSGLLQIICDFIAPISSKLGMPAQIVPMAMLRPVSGSGSSALLINIYEKCGPDSLSGQIASVLASATETTFYAITVYFGSVGIKKCGCTLYCGLVADFTALVIATLSVNIFL